jgi:hypothetical protein
MGRGEPLLLWNKKFILLVTAIFFVVGCATSARDLPEDHSSISAERRVNINDFDAASKELTCTEIDEALNNFNEKRTIHNDDIEGNRGMSQAVVFIGGVVFLLVDPNGDAKTRIKEIDRAKDSLYKLRAFKKCPLKK